MATRTDSKVVPFRQPRIKLPKSLPAPFEPWRHEKCWICFEFRWDASANDDEGGWRKPPTQTNGELAQPNCADHFTTYDRALSAAKRNDGWGIGISLNFAKLAGVDLDKSRNPKTGEPLTDSAATVLDMAKAAGAYVEVSASGAGWHVIGLSKRDATPKAQYSQERETKIEVYVNRVRYFVLTGEQVGECDKFTNIDRVIEWIIGNHRVDRKEGNSTSHKFNLKVWGLMNRGLTDDEIEEHIKKYSRRWEGTKAQTFIDRDYLTQAIEPIRADWEKENPENAARLKRKNRPTVLAPANTRTKKSIPWQWWPYLPGGRITLLAGTEGVGKGLLCCDLASRINAGQVFPFSKEHASKGGVLWIEAEDDLDDTLIPRLEAAEADLSMMYLRAWEECPPLDQLRGLIDKHNIKLIIFSPLNLFLKAQNQNTYFDVAEALAAMQSSVRGTDCAIIGITHLNKKTDTLEALERIIGSRAYTAFVRNVWIVREDDDGMVRLMHAKPSIAVRGDDLLYEKKHVDPARPRDQFVAIDWSRPEQNTELRAALAHNPTDDRGAAGKWLYDYLKIRGEMELNAIQKAAASAGFKWSTIEKARLRSTRIGRRGQGYGKAREVWWRIKKPGDSSRD